MSGDTPPPGAELNHAAAPPWISIHPRRRELADEVHARPFELLPAPARASHLALLSGESADTDEHRLVTELCERYGVPPPPVGTNHFSANLGPFRLKWERHTEFSTYTFLQLGAFSSPFEEPVLSLVPGDWLRSLHGQILVATHVALESRETPQRELAALEELFEPHALVGSEVAGGAAVAWTDFRIHDDGFTRILVHDVDLRTRQAGRLVQRLLEIETYRTMALLALPLAREYGPDIAREDQALAQATARMTDLKGLEDERALLDELSMLAARIERITAATNYRFSAARAYYDLVQHRLSELREQRIEGQQTFSEFMERRLAPAMRTCESVRERQDALAARVGRANNLLRARIDIALEGQNRDLLESMDRRAHLQLRLQETVEGLSVIVLSYYLVGLVSYALKGAKAAGLHVDYELLSGAAIPFVVAAVFFGARRFRRALSVEEGRITPRRGSP